MTEITLYPTKSLKGKIACPPSKSHSQRAILLASMADGISELKNVLPSPDVDAMMNGCSLMGAKILAKDQTLFIEGSKQEKRSSQESIHAGNSGQVFRFLTAMLAVKKGKYLITGDESLQNSRPILPLVHALSQLGAHCKFAKDPNFLPLALQGPIKCGKVKNLNGEDSQSVSALLMALSFVEGTSEIFVENPGEKPWIDLTLSWLTRMGVQWNNHSYEHYIIEGNPKRKPFSYTVSGDFSSALFPITAALITKSNLLIQGLDFEDVQGDRKVIDLLQKMGAQISIDRNKKSLAVSPSEKIVGVEIDINPYIDALPILAVLGCFAEGTTRIFNGKIARKKESDRISTICSELKKMGANIEEKEDGLIVRKSTLIGSRVNGHKDHRIIMSLFVAGLGAKGKTTLTDCEYVQKSFFQFFEKMQSLGVNIE